MKRLYAFTVRSQIINSSDLAATAKYFFDAAVLVSFAAGGYPQSVVKRTIWLLFLASGLAAAAAAQGKPIDVLKKEIRDLKADKEFTLTYDQDSDSSKLMAISENFAQRAVECEGARAINFAAAFTFSGRIMAKEPETINLTFWVLAKKPQFVNAHHWTLTGPGDALDLGDARYAARASENMEYLNFIISREKLTRIAVAGTTFRLGQCSFGFTPSQTKLLANLLIFSKP